MKNIFMNWFQGWATAPEICNICKDSWAKNNPDWNLVLLDETNLDDYTNLRSILPNVRTNPANYSDILRIFLMKEHGGVWADATLFCNKPLSNWVTDSKDSFIFTRSDYSYTNKIICNWFVYSEEKSVLIDELYNRTIEYWEKNPVQMELNYFMHDIVWDMYRQHTPTRSIMDSWSHIECTTTTQPHGRGAHFFVPYEVHFNSEVTTAIKRRVESQVDPLYKLTHKLDYKGSKLLEYFKSLL